MAIHGAARPRRGQARDHQDRTSCGSRNVAHGINSCPSTHPRTLIERTRRILAFLLQATIPIGQSLDQMSLVERLLKYTAIGASSIIGEEANPIGAGLWVRHGRAGMFGVIAAITLGTWVASMLLYYVGRWRIEWVRARWPQKRRLLEGALKVVERHPWRSSLAIRFAYGLRIPLPIACGAARLPVSLYAIAAFISCLVWSAAFTYLGKAFGGVALRFLSFTGRLDVKLGAVALVLMAVLFFITRRRIIGERTAHVLSGEDIALRTTAEREAPHRFLH